MDQETLKWLIEVDKRPIARDGNPDGIPFDLATRMLKEGLIYAARSYSVGIAVASRRIWDITEKGAQALVAAGLTSTSDFASVRPISEAKNV